jgi:hypothetical protein
MTLPCARIADTVVAEQHFSASRAVDADTQAVKPLADERNAAARHRQLLGNGHCTRPRTRLYDNLPRVIDEHLRRHNPLIGWAPTPP